MNHRMFLALAAVAVLGSTVPSLAHPPDPIFLAQATTADIFALGPLRLGMSQQDVQGVLGPPASDAAGEMSQATGAFTKSWVYAEQGVGVTLSSPEPEGPYTVESIILEEPSTYRGVFGIGIGTFKTEAYQQFKTLLTEDINSFDGDTDDKFGVMVQSKYIVLAVGCVDGVVKHIYLGPGPE